MNRSILQIFLAMACCLLTNSPLSAQNAGDDPVTVQSPETAVFAKSGNIPVGTYTGTASVNVPLFTIEDGPISIPLSLNYNTSGIRVQEESSWTGLGFMLNTGGRITRSVRGQDDLQAPINGFYNYTSVNAWPAKPLFTDPLFTDPPNQRIPFQKYFQFDPSGVNPLVPDTLWMHSTIDSVNLLDINYQPFNYDWIPDLFYYSAGSASGKFELDNYLVPMELSKSNTRISYSAVNGPFRIATEDGLVYTYDIYEFNTPVVLPGQTLTTAWYPSSVRSADGNHVVTFHYGRGIMQTNPVTTYAATGYSNGTIQTTSQVHYDAVDYPYLTEIDFKGGKVMLGSSSNRQDLTGARKLDSLVQYDSLGVKTKKYSFKYSYFVAGAPDSLMGLRLRLDSVLENDDTHLSYRMTYDTTNLPGKDGGVDHWGYSNNTGYGIPLAIYPVQTPLTGGGSVTTYQQYGGGSYEAQWPYTQSMTLTKLSYPTGGYSKFSYEPNEFGNVPDYWQYEIVTPPPVTALDYPITSVDNGSVAIDPTVSGPYNLSCTFYCPDPSSLTDFYIDFLVDGTTVLLKDLTQFSQFNGIYTLSASAISFGSGVVTCKVFSNSSVSLFQNFNLRLTTMGNLANSLVRKNLTRMTGGGLRIKTVVNNDGLGETTYKQYNYNYANGSSSGTIMSFPAYLYYPTVTSLSSNIYSYFSSNSVIGLSTSASGSYIGYTHVTEYIGDSARSNGSTEYIYTNLPDLIPYTYGSDLPTVRQNENGLLVQKVDYDANHTEVSELDNTYSSLDTNWKSTTGVKIVPIPASGQNTSLVSPPMYAWLDYQMDYKLLSSTQLVFDGKSPQRSLQTTTSYQYGDNIHPRKISKTTSTAAVQDQTEYRYANDFTMGTVPAFVQEMKDSNIVDKPVEQVQSKTIGESNMAIGGQLLEYGTGSSRGLAKNQYSLDIAAPLSWSDSNFSSALSGSSFIYNPNYALKKSFGYQQGNITDYTTPQMKTAYLWAYDQRYPVAECVNATSNEVYAENFEENTASGVTSGAAHTGTHYYSGAYTVSWTKPDSRNYVISYWYRSSGVWKLSAPAAYNGPTRALSGGDAYDDIRIYPADAQITTFTYQPLIGMTSKSDVNNRVTSYEYDSFGRLHRIRDQDQNILKTFDYQYQATNGCGPNCFVEPMQTLAGTNTLGYPVGVFNVHGNLLGNAAGPGTFVSLWNADTADSHSGTLAAGADSLHFTITLNTGKSLPQISGCRYYQVDLHWTQLDALRNFNAAYVDFGDGTGMHMGLNLPDTLTVLAPGTSQSQAPAPGFNQFAEYFVHNYPDTTLKTITFYHNDAAETEDLDNLNSPAASLAHLKNLRGNLPQNTNLFGGSSYQQPTMLSVANISNWGSIHTIINFNLNTGDEGITMCENLNYAQDFMAANKKLDTVLLQRNGLACYFDSTFKISRFKSDWNTYFTNLRYLSIADAQWNKEDLSALVNLDFFFIIPGRPLYSNNATGNTYISMNSTEIDNIINQIAAGAGRTVNYGTIVIVTGGANRTSNSDAAFRVLTGKGWQINIDTTSR
jgi:YD repeat-containing protein